MPFKVVRKQTELGRPEIPGLVSFKGSNIYLNRAIVADTGDRCEVLIDEERSMIAFRKGGENGFKVQFTGGSGGTISCRSAMRMVGKMYSGSRSRFIATHDPGADMWVVDLNTPLDEQ